MASGWMDCRRVGGNSDGHGKVICVLEIERSGSRAAEIALQQEGRLLGDPALSVDDLVKPCELDAQVWGNLDLGHAPGLDEVVQEHLAGVGR